MIKEELLNANADQLLQQKGIIANIERYAINDGNQLMMEMEYVLLFLQKDVI